MKRILIGAAVAATALAGLGGELVDSLACAPQAQFFDGVSQWWLQRFDAKRFECATNAEVNVVFLGDSITHNWEFPGKEVWAKNFAKGRYAAVNCGISSERTENLIWRIEHGQFANRVPKAFVLMIGTNNLGQKDPAIETPADTICGIRRIVQLLQMRYPESKIVLHPIFPRGAKPDCEIRQRVEAVNRWIRYLADGEKVLWCDFNAKLMEPDGTLTKEHASDLLHPNACGYEVWAEALKPFLDYALGRSETAPKSRARPAPTAIAADGPRAACPDVKMYWLANKDPKVQPRIRDKRIEETANADRYYDAIWIGDSITHFWEHKGKCEVFKEKFGRYRILNLGFGGDKTQNLLWNVKYGGFLDGVQTRLITLMIGTNNTWVDSAEDIASGIGACLKAIREKQPQAKILLFTVLPREVAHKRGETDFRRTNWNVDEIMPKQTKVNELIRPLADGKDVILVDLCPKFTDAEGLPDVTLLGDGTHPNEDGYRVWADEVLPLYRKILGR